MAAQVYRYKRTRIQPQGTREQQLDIAAIVRQLRADKVAETEIKAVVAKMLEKGN